MAPLGQTVAVFDKSGKVVSTSKQLFGVFSQAKNAYRDRKAQIQSERNLRIAEKQALKAMQNYTIDDAPYEPQYEIQYEPSVAPSQRSRRSRSRYSSGRSHYQHRDIEYEQDLYSEASRSEYQPADMVRRHTQPEISMREPPRRPGVSRSMSDANIDMDLAYGDFNPDMVATRDVPPPMPPPPQQQQLQQFEDPELNGLVDKAQMLLEEAQCVQASATATIAHLQKNPEAMAAVALTLAEISNLAAKMAPAALSAFKTMAPTIFGLLASPQFLIAAGVGIGVTIVMFGGFKIIKQITGNDNSDKNIAPTAAPQIEEPPTMEEMLEINTEHLSSVEMWRRGVADAEASSVATSVDGEYITERAAAMSGIDVTTARMTRDPRFKFDDDESLAPSQRS
ncbi:hypothetical protein ASPWEDRAFT_98739, partial [Aspergillus wentii DTO 134E9]